MAAFQGLMGFAVDCARAGEVLRRDVEAVRRYDPAARSTVEVLLTYPGVHALWGHRAAHRLWKQGHLLSARVVSHVNRFVTGIEIHPGARIGAGVFIDHGMGIVIGETAHIGDECLLFKGVVLGGNQSVRCQRHPQLGDRVVVGSNACVLGNIEIGDDARIGSGSVVVKPVPAGATVVGVPGRVVPPRASRDGAFEHALDHTSLPDPTADVLRSLHRENERLRARLARIEARLAMEDNGDDSRSVWDDRDGATVDLPPQHGG